MRTVDMEEAKTQLPGLVEEALKGEPFIIAEAGRPRVEVTVKALEAEQPPRKRWIGALAGLYTVPDDFDTMADKEMAEMVEIIENKKF